MIGPAQRTGLRATVAAAAVALYLLTSAGSDGQRITNETKSTHREMAFETLTVRVEGGVLFAAIAAPPMNLLGPALVRDLVSLITQAEAAAAVKVLVFTSTDPDYFIAHVDVTQITEYREEAAKLTGEPSIALLFRHLSASRLVTIAQIEGRVRGAGSEFVLACDMRFAARDSDLFSEGVRNPEAHKRIQAALKRGFQTRDAEMSLGRLLGDLADR